MINKEAKLDIITQYGLSEGDTGSTAVQVALMTKRINLLTEHLKIHTHDCHSRRALYKVLGQRRRFLSYLKRKDTEQYYSLNNKLGLRS